MEIEILYTEEAHKSAIIEIDEAEYMEWSGGEVTDKKLKGFLLSTGNTADWADLIDDHDLWDIDERLDSARPLLPKKEQA